MTETLNSLIRNYEIKIRAVKIPDPPPFHEGPGPYAGQGWQCTLRFDGRRMTVPFWMGPGHVDWAGQPRTPKVRDLLECLLADSSGADQSFEDWCGDYGYDTDSRKAYGIWTSVENQTGALKHLLAGTYGRFIEAEQ